jgi:Ca2+-binding RTX toxin-like protein
MARIAYYAELGLHGSLTDFYDPAQLTVMGTPTATREVLLDSSSLNEIILSGSGMTYSGGVVTGGTIGKINFRTGPDQSLISVTQQDFDAAQLSSVLFEGGLKKMLALMLSGSDTVIGSNIGDTLIGLGGKDLIKAGGGADFITGGHGNDTLYGGGGSDLFVFKAGDGKDVIRDFDANGGGANQDYIGADFSDVKKFLVDHHNLIVEFGHGDQILLFDVARSEITAADFQH